MKVRTCTTCRKLNLQNNQCLVLKRKIKENCWAWSDDPEWAKKVRIQVRQYELGKV